MASSTFGYGLFTPCEKTRLAHSVWFVTVVYNHGTQSRMHSNPFIRPKLSEHAMQEWKITTKNSECNTKNHGLVVVHEKMMIPWWLHAYLHMTEPKVASHAISVSNVCILGFSCHPKSTGTKHFLVFRSHTHRHTLISRRRCLHDVPKFSGNQAIAGFKRERKFSQRSVCGKRSPVCDTHVALWKTTIHAFLWRTRISELYQGAHTWQQSGSASETGGRRIQSICR